jgi:TolB-like protein/Flp pilus assembly protein TadD
MSFFAELHRRNVVRVAVAYTVICWVLLQVADVVLEGIGAPEWVMKTLLLLLLLGLIPAVVFAWVFELTPEGLKRESEIAEGASVVHQTRRRLDVLIMVALVGAVGYLFWDGKLRGSGDESPAAQMAGGETATPGANPGSAQSNAMEELERVTAERDALNEAAAAGGNKSIAVLPFVNLSSDPEQEFFSDGISEELLNVLAQIPSLRVAARTSSFQFKGDNRDISEIAELLKVEHVLEGSVRKAGSRLRITAQLIEARNGYHLWSDTYDRELEDVFAIQDEISNAIADAMRTQLGLDDLASPAASRATANTSAYEAFLKGRGLINQRGNAAITEGVAELERSIRLDPNYAPARAQLAIGIALLANTSGSYGDIPIVEVNERGEEQIAAAAALDEDFAELWAARAILALTNADASTGLAFLDRALELRPNYADVLSWRVSTLGELGRTKDATAAMEEMLELDPLTVIGRMNAVVRLSRTQPERAMAIARSIAAQSPWASHASQARVFAAKQQPDRQLEQLLLAYALDSKDQQVNYFILEVFAAVGLAEESLRVSRSLRPWALLSLDRYEEAEEELRAVVEADPDDLEATIGLAESLFSQARYAEAEVLWQQALVETDFGMAVYSNGGNGPTFQRVLTLRALGEDAQAATQLQVLEGLEADAARLGGDSPWVSVGRGGLAVLQGDRSAALAFLETAVEKGLALGGDVLEAPIFEPLRDEPALVVMNATVKSRIERQREKVLDLICNNNPVPDYWRPLPETCADV